jgi:hypothetical protein
MAKPHAGEATEGLPYMISLDFVTAWIELQDD